MPRVVDHEQRRREIGQALWRVVEREGMPGMSVRSVASEAGLSAGSLRHFFGSQAELLVFAVELLVERTSGRILARVETIGEGDDPIDWLTELFKEGLPLDRARSAEMEVWNAFMEGARTDALLEPARRMEWAASQWLCRTAVVNLLGLAIETGAETPLDEPLEAEASLLHVVWDGLVSHLFMLPEGERERIADRLLRLHMEGIHGRTTAQRRLQRDAADRKDQPYG